jgi:ABC-type cobalamin/Fe3+-siderophores transport system ATPase subunit
MKILAVDLPELPDVDLDSIKMEKLGAVVVIAGRNGAGKSRLLRKIEELMGPKFVAEATISKDLENHRRALKNNPQAPETAGWKTRITELEKQLSDRRCITLSEASRPQIVRFVPTQLSLQDPNTLARSELKTAADGIEILGTQNLARGTFSKIQLCQNRRWEATHSEKTISEDESQKAVGEYGRLRELISQFLNADLARSVDGEATLFGLALGKSNLSDGQIVILQLCVAIHTQATRMSDVILLMDEPENHLHPAALLDLIEVVKDKLPNGQIWIATHSVPLLANIDSSCIWWMEDGSISKAGSKPEIVLEGLLGNEVRRDRLAGFLDLPFVLASNKFASECLLPPATVASAIRDPQMQQITRMLEHLNNKAPTLRLLDYGAGKGRLAAEIAEGWSPEQRIKIDYVAFDPFDRDAEECRTAIARLHDNPERRLFHDHTALRAQYDEGTFHVVVMCNVLHEILPSDWSDLFGPQGKITRLLHPEGFVLLVEVQQLPYGERAHHQGFLVLDTAQLKKLFSIREADTAGFTHASAKDGWLKAHLISKPLVERFTHASLRSALIDLRDTAQDRIRGLRGGGSDYRSGRLHGFWVQQFANASLAIT